MEGLRQLLSKFQKGNISIDEMITRLSVLPYENLEFAKVDHHRALRKGFPEVIYGQGKTAEQIISIIESMVKYSDKLLATRIEPNIAKQIAVKIPESVYYNHSRLLAINKNIQSRTIPGVVVISGGTSDQPITEEVIVTAEIMDCDVTKIVDAGVAGIHRLLDNLDTLSNATVVVAIAGMEGALPSVVGGLTRAPVIAVPTSVGYGSSFGGIAALLAMLNSCAPGVAVVNIDNGFGAGYIAANIARLADSTDSNQRQ